MRGRFVLGVAVLLLVGAVVLGVSRGRDRPPIKPQQPQAITCPTTPEGALVGTEPDQDISRPGETMTGTLYRHGVPYTIVLSVKRRLVTCPSGVIEVARDEGSVECQLPPEVRIPGSVCP